MLTNEDLKKYHASAERILTALENGRVPISWHDSNRCALESVIAKELMLLDREEKR